MMIDNNQILIQKIDQIMDKIEIKDLLVVDMINLILEVTLEMK